MGRTHWTPHEFIPKIYIGGDECYGSSQPRHQSNQLESSSQETTPQTQRNGGHGEEGTLCLQKEEAHGYKYRRPIGWQRLDWQGAPAAKAGKRSTAPPKSEKKQQATQEKNHCRAHLKANHQLRRGNHINNIIIFNHFQRAYN